MGDRSLDEYFFTKHEFEFMLPIIVTVLKCISNDQQVDKSIDQIQISI